MEFPIVYKNFNLGIPTKIKSVIQILRFAQLTFLLSTVLLFYSYGITAWSIGCFSIALSMGLAIEAMRRRLLEMKIELMIETGQIKGM